jgi:hypothetical protein
MALEARQLVLEPAYLSPLPTRRGFLGNGLFAKEMYGSSKGSAKLES